MPAPEKMSTFTVAYDPAYERGDDTVTAAYHRPSDLGDFIDFKDKQHATVFSVQSKFVLSVRRG